MAPGTSGRTLRKQQTRLSFDPIEESSSQSTMPPAKVRYEVPGATRRFTHRTSRQNPLNENKTSPAEKGVVAFDKSPRKKKGRKLMSSQTLPQMMSSQTHGLVNEVNGLDLQESDSDVIVTSSRSTQKSRSAQKAKRQPESPPPLDLSLVPAGASGFMPRTSKQSRISSYTTANDSSSSEGSSPEENYKELHQKRSQIPISVDDDTDQSSLKSPVKVRQKSDISSLPNTSPIEIENQKALSSTKKHRNSSPRKKTSSRGATNAISIPDDEDDDEDEIVLPSARKPSRSSPTKLTVGLDEDDSDDVFGPIRSSQRARKVVADDDDDDSDEDLPENPSIIASRSSQRLKPTSSMKRKRASPSDQSGSSESDVAPSPKKKHQPSRRDRNAELSSNDFVDEDETVPKSQSRKGKGKAKDIDEKEETRVTRARVDKKPKRTAKQKQMELLRRRRAGENIDAVTDSSSDEGDRGAIYDSDSDNEALSQFDDESQDEEIKAVAKSLRPNNRNEYDDSFVVEDDDAPLGAPGMGLHDIPLEFTHHAHKRLKDHFKDTVEWMVQNKINPGFERGDPIYKQAFRKVDDEAHGFASSKFSSSAWKLDFMRALWARPIFMESAVERGDENEGRKCDACGRSGHPAKFVLQFDGSPYDQVTLEDIVNDSDDDSDEDDNDNRGTSRRQNRVERNSEGHRIPSAETVWYVGRFCKANAESAHALVHWRHSLNSWVVQQLQDEGYMSPTKLAERAKLSKKKLGKLAMRIIDDWEARREIKSLYDSFKATMNTARQTTQGRWSH